MGGDVIKVVNSEFISDVGEDYGRLQMDEKQILTGERCLDYKTLFKLSANLATRHLVPMEFTYGYAITGHKAQGSQWGNVLVLEERFPFEREEHARWLYTCCTRAVDKLVLVR
jgi:ATP-dependent exoDNAse (exonuclease V) alpha subunit